jgi:hypothetical protein
MRLQDIHPYDSAIVGLNNIYRVDYKGYFFINAHFIISPNKKISTGSTYVLIYSPNGKNKKVHLVGFLDAYYDDGVIYLIVRDIASKETFTIDQQMKCTGDHFKWVLVDFDYLAEELNSEIIKSYCGLCKKMIKRIPATDSNHGIFNNDLLEFDF